MLKVKISKTNAPSPFLTFDQIKRVEGIYEVAEGSHDRDVLLISSYNEIFVIREDRGHHLCMILPDGGWDAYKYIKSNKTVTVTVSN